MPGDERMVPSDPGRRSTAALLFRRMTAKEKLREQVEALTEEDASKALRLLELGSEPVVAAFRDAPVDDEPLSREHEAALEQSRSDLRQGKAVPLDEIRDDFS